jgi:hypothetical protein
LASKKEGGWSTHNLSPTCLRPFALTRGRCVDLKQQKKEKEKSVVDDCEFAKAFRSERKPSESNSWKSATYQKVTTNSCSFEKNIA